MRDTGASLGPCWRNASSASSSKSDVLTARDDLEAQQSSHEAISNQLEQANKRFEVGLIAVTDVEEAKAANDQAAAAVRDEARNHDLFGTLILRAAIPSNRNDPKLLRQLGAACEAIHRLPEARAWYKLAISADPLDSESQKALYWLTHPTESRP